MYCASSPKGSTSADGCQMIRTIEIQNFRAYKKLEIENCNRINIVVGDNGVGKTALLEAIFLALASSAEVAIRLRQQRGLDFAFTGSAARIEEAIWGEYFYNGDMGRPITIAMSGDGPEARSLTIRRGSAQQTIPFDDKLPNGIVSGPVTFVWKDHAGVYHEARPVMSQTGLQVPSTVENIPEVFFHFPSSGMSSSVENATRFSELSKARKQETFTQILKTEYPWLEDLRIEVVAGMPGIFATIVGQQDKIPLPSLSGGINRIIGILLAVASRKRSVVLVDEIENGIYYKHQIAIWHALLAMARQQEAQLFLSTHSKEWLMSLIAAAGENVGDISLWRVERGVAGPEVRQFSGETLRAGIEHGVEVRGSDDI